jgi:GNAT superfamily N-acetyltransferase
MLDALIRRADPADAARIAALIDPVFERFMAPGYDEEGRLTFRAFIDTAAIARRLHAGGLGWIAEEGTVPVGYVERTARHIHLLFVRAEWHGRGLARRLLAAATVDLGPGAVTLNASPYALAIYEQLGFRPSGEQRTITGVVSTPMSLTLE